MSEMSGEPCGSANSPPHTGVDPGGRSPALLELCDRIASWVANGETKGTRVDYAEANCMDVEAADVEEVQVLLEMECLATKIAAMHAANQTEIEGKRRALNGLTSISAWERDSLFALRCSIERDQAEVNLRLFAARGALSPAQRQNWLSRSSVGAAKG